MLCVFAAACGKGNKNTSSAPAPSTTSVTVSSIDLGRAIGTDKRVSDATDTFKPSDTIYASVQTTGSSSSTTIKARWTYQDGQVVNESTQTIAPNGQDATEFHISKPDGWPKGKYSVEITLDGQPAGTKEFTVQ
jgi:hypothetical protein